MNPALPLEWYLSEYHRLLYSQFNLQFYLLNNQLNRMEELYAAITVVQYHLYESAGNLQLFHTWSIALNAFGIAVLFGLILFVVWSTLT